MSWLHAVLDVPEAHQSAAADFWGAATGWPVGEPWPGHPGLRSLTPPAGAPYVHLQRTGSGTAGVHLDVESPDPRARVEAALAAGATSVAVHPRWHTLRSPGGLPFCVLAAAPHESPEPLELDDGHRVRLVQVCLDSPADRHEAEVAFWRELLGEHWYDARSPEFAGKWHDGRGSPLQLLFQRLETSEGRVRAHLDLGTDDLDAEAGRLLALGAHDVDDRSERGWHVLRDPGGAVFCVTANDPAQRQERDLG